MNEYNHNIINFFLSCTINIPCIIFDWVKVAQLKSQYQRPKRVLRMCNCMRAHRTILNPNHRFFERCVARFIFPSSLLCLARAISISSSVCARKQTNNTKILFKMFDKTSKRPRIDTLGQTSEEEEPERIYRMLKTLGEKKREPN